jgi:hypothetical protein
MRRLYEGEADIGPTREAAMFEEPDGVFLVTRTDGRAVACGGVCRFDETQRLGYRGIVLETGDRQPEALGLYRSSGYAPIPCYPPYDSRALSLCFEKRLPLRE